MVILGPFEWMEESRGVALPQIKSTSPHASTHSTNVYSRARHA